jgi:Flp pilus assembly pilin Flp
MPTRGGTPYVSHVSFGQADMPFNFSKGDFFIMDTLKKATQQALAFLADEEGQDFAEYALILGAVGVVAIAVIVRYRNELIASFNQGIEALRAARGG